MCDREARALLGKRGAAIQNAPVRYQVAEGANGHVEGLNAVSRTLLRRYREVAADMAPFRQRNMYEVHPELSFFQLNNDVPLRWSKRTEAGRGERRALLVGKIPGVQRILEAELPKVPYFAPARHGRVVLDGPAGLCPRGTAGSRRPPVGRRRTPDGVRPLNALPVRVDDAGQNWY